MPAVYITNPELYADQYYQLESSLKDLTTGRLELTEVDLADDQLQQPGVINIPTQIKDIEKLKKLIFSAWEQAK